MDAAIHHAIGSLPKVDVPVGTWNLDGIKIVTEFDNTCVVERKPGRGDGTEQYIAASKGLSLPAICLFVQRAGCTGPHTLDLWKRCILDALAAGDTLGDVIPEEALVASRQVQEALADVKGTRKTPAKRFGKPKITLYKNGMVV